jgi:hypothetical protein
MITMCPRSDSHLTYMIDIALTTQFAITAGEVRRPEQIIRWSTAGAVAGGDDEHEPARLHRDTDRVEGAEPA